MSYHEHDKDRTVQHKKIKGALPNIVSPAKKSTSEVELSDENSPIEKEEGVNDRKYEKYEKNDEEKEAECPDDTPLVDMEEGVSDRKNNKNEKNDEEKET